MTSRIEIVGLKVDQVACPLGLENLAPLLSWQLRSCDRDIKQQAYRILVSTSEALLAAGKGDLWDSGIVESSHTFSIPYEGTAVASRLRCYWRVEVWVVGKTAAARSETSWWEMGLLSPSDWAARWLTFEDPVTTEDRETGLQWIWGEPGEPEATRVFRTTFTLPEAASGGRLLAVTHDWSTWTQVTRVWLDDRPLAGLGSWSDDYDKVGVTESDRRWEETGALDAGDHVIAVEVATGPLWTCMTPGDVLHGLAVLARFELQSGAFVRICAGPDWKTTIAPSGDWASLSFDDSAWDAATHVSLDYQPFPPRPASHLRTDFTVDQTVASARLYATALGAYEAHLNGDRVGDALLTPEIAQYAKRVLYQVFDVTAMIRQGANALGLTLGDGWYAGFDGRFAWGPPPVRVLAQLELVFEDGSRQLVATDADWRATQSAILESQLKSGEIFDARLHQPGWSLPGFDASSWSSAQIADTPPCQLSAQVSPPIRATTELEPKTITEPRPGVYLVDFGQHFTGWCRLHAAGDPGTRITLRYAELVDEQGEIEIPYSNIGKAKRDVFILDGTAGEECFEPHFTFRAFRYVEVTGLSSLPTPETLKGIFVHSDLPVTGRLRSSSELVEQIWQAIVWTRKSNFVGVPMDTPSREQRGYLASALVCWDGAAYNVDVASFTARLMDNVVDDQAAGGAFPQLAPAPRWNNSLHHLPGNSPGWGEGGVVMPWTAWRRYGDVGIIRENWEPMNRHLAFIENANPDYVWRNERGADFGDWLALDDDSFLDPDQPPSTPKDLVGTAYWAYLAALLAQMAEATGLSGDAERLRGVFTRVREAFNSEFVHGNGTVGTGSQTAYVLALKFDLLSPDARRRAGEHLAADVTQRGVSLTTGIHGAQFILDVLADVGRADLAYGLLLRTEMPSWGYMISQGATAIWETWDGLQTGKNARGDTITFKLARNHSDFATISGFLFRRLAGIEEACPGFREIIIRPLVDPRVISGGGDFDSVVGRISTDWEQRPDGGFTLDVTVPANTSATVHLPVKEGSRIEEAGQEWPRDSDPRITDWNGTEAVIKIGSGRYNFAVST